MPSKDRPLYYDLPRVEETFTTNDWRILIGRRELLFFASQARAGLKCSFQKRRKEGMEWLLNSAQVAEEKKLDPETIELLGFIWTMPNHVLKTISSTVPVIKGGKKT